MYNKVEYLVREQEDDRGRLTKRTWHDPERLAVHRTKGPAVEGFDPETSKQILEIWIDQRYGGRHRDGDLPAEVSKDPVTDVVTYEEYCLHGDVHREGDKPAEIYRDRDSGNVTGYSYCVSGVRHRDGDLPAVIEFDPVTSEVTREEYYQYGEIYRENGPAIIEYDGDRNVILDTLEFHKGERLSDLKYDKPQP